jgi:hypothetical protein
VGGFLLTLTVFVGGGLTAIFFVNAKPVPVAHPFDGNSGALWTSKAVGVSADARDLKRLPARPAPQALDTAPRNAADANRSPGNSAPLQTVDDPAQATDPTTTAAMSPDEPEPQAAPATNAAHVEWCSRHYRSYDPADNGYSSYSGVRRECVSPYSDGMAHADSAVSGNMVSSNVSGEGAPALVSSAAADEMPGGYPDPHHVQSCSDRYRSYRPEDNSYQPFGGGPRQQCE